MARRKASDKKVEGKKNSTASGEGSIHHVQADDHSIAFEELHVGGDVGGDIRIGHNIGYTVEQVSVLLKQITTTLEPKKFDGRCPYKGLDVFEEEDADLFFGRERLIEDLLNRVKESRTVFITGPSGSGKSSLVRAGLIHTLKQGKIKSSERWLYETMKPGREPLKDLALAFSRLKSPELEDYFRAHAGETDILNKCAESVLSGKKDQRFVLFVDQFEEVFTQISGEEERIAFINMLAHAGTIENGRVIVLFAMRSDFVSNCATYPLLNEMLSQEFRQIGAMQPEELVSAIALPARHVGLPIEDELIARIINDMKGEPGALPLMQFALKDLFDSQQEKGGVIALTLADYLKHGGIHKSLERHADKTFAKLSESEQELARSIFSGLIEIGRGTQDTKRTALFDELVPANVKTEEVETIVRKLADARLIITDEQAGKDTVTISHEKLIEAWPWLKKLVNENRDAIALQNEIAADAKEWEEHQRDASYLYSGARLANAREQLEAKKLVLSETSREFVKAGQVQEQRNQRIRIIGVAVPIGLVVFAVIIFSYIFSTNSANIANQNRDFAETQEAAASTSQAVAVIAQANAEEAQKQANIALARQLAAQAQSIYVKKNAKQVTAFFLAVRSMQMYSTLDAAQLLQNNNLAHPVAFMKHDDFVWSVAFSPDGKYVVSGSGDNTLRVLKIAKVKEVSRMSHDGSVNSVAFSLDGKYIVSGSNDFSARVWETITGKEVARMRHDHNVNCVVFSPDGKYVLSGSTDGTARVWEAATGREIARMTHNSAISSVAFSPDGKYVASASNYWINYLLGENKFDLSVRVWEATTGKESARMTHDGQVSAVAFSPDGVYVVSSGSSGESGVEDYTARVWEAATGKEVTRMTHDYSVTSVAFSPDSKFVVSGGDFTARVWDAVTGKEVARVTHDDWVTSVAFSPDGKYVASGSEDNTARVWEAATGKEITRINSDGNVLCIAFSTDGKYIISGSDDSTARVWDVSPSKEIIRFTFEDSINSVVFSPDSQYILSGSSNGIVRVSDATSGQEIAHMTHDYSVTSVVFSPDGKYIASASNDSTARVWEATTGREIARMNHDNWVYSVAFSPDGKYVASGSYAGPVHVWEAATGKEVTHMTHGFSVYSVAFNSDGTYLVSGGYGDDTLRVWETASWQEVAHMNHGPDVSSVTFSPNGKYIASGGGDGIVRIWEVVTSRELVRLPHDARVFSVAFSSDSKYVVVGSCDTGWSCPNGGIHVWELNTGKEIVNMTYEGIVSSVAFSPDGKYIISGGSDGTVRLWVWQAEDLIENACAHLLRNPTPEEWLQYFPGEKYRKICDRWPLEPEVTATPSPTP